MCTDDSKIGDFYLPPDILFFLEGMRVTRERRERFYQKLEHRKQTKRSKKKGKDSLLPNCARTKHVRLHHYSRTDLLAACHNTRSPSSASFPRVANNKHYRNEIAQIQNDV